MREVGDFVDPTQALYSDVGQLICPACSAKAEIAKGDERAAKAILSASGTSVAFGLAASFVLNPCLVVSLLGVASAAGTFALLYRNPEHRAKLGARLPLAIGIATLGLVLSLAAPLIRLVLLATAGYGGVL